MTPRRTPRSASSSGPPRSTLEETIAAGEVAGSGPAGVYRRLEARPGEPRILRRDLLDPVVAGAPRAPRRSLLHLAHVTDLQLADCSSPGRFEFFESLRGTPGSHAFVPAQRPQETLLVHALESMVRSINVLGASPETGAPLDLVLSTGDNIDNAQWNELCCYLALLGGGRVELSPGPFYEGVQAPSWPPGPYWRPDGADSPFNSLYGFPSLPGLLEEAVLPFDAAGLEVPWVSCFGNHDGLPFGESVPTPAYREIVTGARKAFTLPDGLDALSSEERLFAAPEELLAGPSVEVQASAERRVVGRRDFVSAHLAAPGRPAGHGFSARNLETGTAYSTYDPSERVRLVLLDTANLDGQPTGSIGARQLAWLEETLSACHSRHLSEDGRWQRGGGEDRIVVLASHHGPSTLTNHRQVEGGLEEDHPRATAEEVLSLLHRFPNVVLWLTGHRHVNEVVARRAHANPVARAGGSGGGGVAGAGIWEISTVSVADWPSQGRYVELVDNRDGTLSILTSMVDHHAPLDPSLATGRQRLASLHRELAGNVPRAGFDAGLAGGLLDRNVELVIASPFDLA